VDCGVVHAGLKVWPLERRHDIEGEQIA